MSHCWYHALSSANFFGGDPKDYLSTHEWLDQVKFAWNYPTHRALLHNTWGVHLAEQLLGPELCGLPTSDVLNRHIMEDIGKVPHPSEWLGCVKLPPLVTVKVSSEEEKEVLDFLLSPTEIWEDMRAPYLLCNTVGVYMAERKFGVLIGGRPTRVIAERLIQIAVGGRIPTVQEVLQGVDIRERWRREAAITLSREVS